jgi:hypothetical protein
MNLGLHAPSRLCQHVRLGLRFSVGYYLIRDSNAESFVIEVLERIQQPYVYQQSTWQIKHTPFALRHKADAWQLREDMDRGKGHLSDVANDHFSLTLFLSKGQQN